MYQVQIKNIKNGSIKMVGKRSVNAKTLENTNKQACALVWKTGLMVTTVRVA